MFPHIFHSLSNDEIDLAKENELTANAQPHAAQQLAVNAVLKLPPFWPLNPVEWFFQVEAVFSTNHINSERTQFMHVLQQLLLETITLVLDIIKQQATLTNP